jgi:hypothetical protein
VIKTFKHNQPISSVAIHDDLCACGGFKGSVWVYKLNDWSLLKVIIARSALIKKKPFVVTGETKPREIFEF